MGEGPLPRLLGKQVTQRLNSLATGVSQSTCTQHGWEQEAKSRVYI